MNKYGTWSTLDAPTKEMSPEATQAMEWLNQELETVEASARFKYNAHDFGTYLSIEVDAPYGFNSFDEDEATDEEYAEHYNIIDKLNYIEGAYSEKFIQ